uniref:Uncharacterized protein n=1 Tax=Leersia perrieri TaxID=77586 RepID=A0A0D9WQ23_9ORYZ
MEPITIHLRLLRHAGDLITLGLQQLDPPFELAGDGAKLCRHPRLLPLHVTPNNASSRRRVGRRRRHPLPPPRHPFLPSSLPHRRWSSSPDLLPSPRTT